MTLLLVLLLGYQLRGGAVEVIGADTPVGKGKKKAIKQEKLKEAELDESAKGTSPETKNRKTGKSQKQLVLSEGKEVEQPLAIRARVKTKVGSSFS